jgi:hypothetical protein
MSSSLQHHRSIWKLLSPIPISSTTVLLAYSRTRHSLGQQRLRLLSGLSSRGGLLLHLSSLLLCLFHASPPATVTPTR